MPTLATADIERVLNNQSKAIPQLSTLNPDYCANPSLLQNCSKYTLWHLCRLDARDDQRLVGLSKRRQLSATLTPHTEFTLQQLLAENNAFICPVLAIGWLEMYDRKHLTAVMPHAGENFSKFMTSPQADQILIQLWSVICFLHSLEISHGDLFSNNLKVSAAETKLAVLDFGMARYKNGYGKLDDLKRFYDILVRTFPQLPLLPVNAASRTNSYPETFGLINNLIKHTL